MSKRKIVGISLAIIILVAASFFVGTLYSPYGKFIVEKTLDAGVIDSRSGLPQVTEPPPTTEERTVIYNAQVSLETGEVQGVLLKIRALAEGYGGYVSSSSRTKDTAQITIRVPKDKFRMAIQEIEGYGKVLDERTTSEDVTERYIDLKARLGNLQKQEKRLHEILAMAKTVDEIIRVEKELERVRGAIESLQGQINYLERSVAMSVITVRLTEPPPPFTPPGMNWKETFETALKGLFAVIRGLIIIVVSVSPFVVIGLSAYMYRRRKRQKQATTAK